jgi:hypothetical protein
MKVHVMGGELSHEDGQTGVHDEANSRFSQGPKMFDDRSNWNVTQNAVPSEITNFYLKYFGYGEHLMTY